MATRSSRPDVWLSLQDLAGAVNATPEKCLKDLKKVAGEGSSKTYVEPQRVRKFLVSQGYKYPKINYSFQMLKGGVAKTTSALNFAWRASMYGARVLMVDMDQQANLTFALGIEAEEIPVWIDVLEKKVQLAGTVINVEQGLDLIPSNLNNSVLDRFLIASHRNWSQAVAGPLKEIRSAYDLVVIDTAPSLSAINTAVTCASDTIVLPVNPDKFSVHGAQKHIADLQELKEEFDLEFETKLLFTRYDGRESSSREIFNQCIDSFDQLLLKNYIRTSSDLKNNIASGKTIFSTKNVAHEDYDLVTRELLGF